MVLSIYPMDAASVRAFMQWRYEPPYDIYNIDASAGEAAVWFFTAPQNSYYQIRDERGALVAFCCFGLEAQVPGGDYSSAALDIGMGVRPDLTGKGRGQTFAAAAIDFARATFAPPALRVTVADFNKRARRVWEKAGFQAVQTFASSYDGRAFVILIHTVP